jgi:DNA gyrase/topoisomerase IV subunit B
LSPASLDKLKEFFEENPAVAKAIYEKAMQAAVPARPPKKRASWCAAICAGKQPYARQAGDCREKTHENRNLHRGGRFRRRQRQDGARSKYRLSFR